jgi:3-methyladenine DNA glycosylase/8-oxoguanine DNA glycosylase
VIGPVVRSVPHLRPWRRPEPWEVLAWAITEQLIDFERAKAIQLRLIARLGRRCAATGLRDMPSPAAVAAAAPAELAASGLAQSRAITLRRAAREVAAGRVRFDAGDAPLRLLRAIPGIGRWTMEMLALYGLGRYDRVPAGDLGYLEIVGRLQTGNPRAHADEAEVRGFFARYGEWQGLAGEYLRLAAARGLLRLDASGG